MNQEAWKKTLETKQTWYYSRTRRKLCKKGEVSGNVQKIKDILVDCDNDTVLLKVEQVGNAACHEGYNSCFFRRIDGKKIEKKVFNPSEVYSK